MGKALQTYIEFFNFFQHIYMSLLFDNGLYLQIN